MGGGRGRKEGGVERREGGRGEGGGGREREKTG